VTFCKVSVPSFDTAQFVACYRRKNSAARGGTGEQMQRSSSRFLVAATMAAFAAIQAPSFAADNASLAAAIDQTAIAAIAAGESAGLQVAVYKDGKPVLVKGYGFANLELKAPVSNDSIFRVGSVTKQFTAAVLLQLAE
jgi:D-alanyl-D-alanine carboxypeptidase